MRQRPDGPGAATHHVRRPVDREPLVAAIRAAGMASRAGFGTGSSVERLWTKPSLSIIGLDAPKVAGSSNTLVPTARARLSMRLAPGDTVVWTFLALHSSTSDIQSGAEFWNSGIMGSGTFSHTFTTPGTYYYYCENHGTNGGAPAPGPASSTSPAYGRCRAASRRPAR